MRNYEVIYALLERIKALTSDDEIFRQSEVDRLASKHVQSQVRQAFPELSEAQIARELEPILRETYLVQFFDFRGQRFFLDLPHLRIFSYLCGCFGSFAPNETLGDFAVTMARLAQENIRYTDESVASVIAELAQQ